MRIDEAIQQVDVLKPNTYSVRQKITWLSRLEAMVKRLVIDEYVGGEDIPFEEFGGDVDFQKELYMPAPFDAAYLYWLEAQICYADGEIGDYNSAISQYNRLYGAYSLAYQKEHMPISNGSRFLF